MKQSFSEVPESRFKSIVIGFKAKFKQLRKRFSGRLGFNSESDLNICLTTSLMKKEWCPEDTINFSWIFSFGQEFGVPG